MGVRDQVFRDDRMQGRSHPPTGGLDRQTGFSGQQALAGRLIEFIARSASKRE